MTERRGRADARSRLSFGLKAPERRALETAQAEFEAWKGLTGGVLGLKTRQSARHTQFVKAAADMLACLDELDRSPELQDLAALASEMGNDLFRAQFDTVRSAVSDWAAMRPRVDRRNAEATLWASFARRHWVAAGLRAGVSDTGRFKQALDAWQGAHPELPRVDRDLLRTLKDAEA